MTSLTTKLTLASAVFLASSAGVSAQETIETPGYAERIANHLVENCPTTAAEAADENYVNRCITATRDATYDIAATLSNYITEHRGELGSFSAGLSNGDLLRYCEGPANALVGREFSSSQEYLNATADFARSCFPSIERSARNVDLVWQPLAFNTTANQVNCLTGRPECVTHSPTIRLK